MAGGIDTIWARDDAEAAGPQPLSRETIVAAAIEIADTEGLEAVSIRRLATKLQARPMSLYSHIERKGDLIDLMVDEVMGGAILPDGPPVDDWREGLRQIAQRTRETARAHPWLIAIAFRRPFIGPNALRHIDQSLGALSSLPLTPERKRAVLLAVDTYTLGFVRWEVKSPKADGTSCAGIPDGRAERRGNRHLPRRPGGDRQVPASGRTQWLGSKDVSLGVKAEAFEVGLEWLLAGIEAEVGGPQAKSN